MAFLLRVELPDVPGSLGALATALGEAGADIEAIEIVEHRLDGMAVDDVLLLPPTVMPDTLITACHELDGVRVHWISRYNAGVNLSMDLEAVEQFTADPRHAVKAELLPATLRVDWALVVDHGEGVPTVRAASPTAPQVAADDPGVAEWLAVSGPTALPEVDDSEQTVLAATPGRLRDGTRLTVTVGRHGGPAFLTSEIARLGHLVALASATQTTPRE